MSIERTSVGLDVHALSVACGIDNETGRLTCSGCARTRRKSGPGWQTARTGPGGLRGRADRIGLYRALTAAGIDTVVTAPSKLQRPAGDRGKTCC